MASPSGGGEAPSPTRRRRVGISISLVIAALTLIVGIIALAKPTDPTSVQSVHVGGNNVNVSGNSNSVGVSNVQVSVGSDGCVAVNGSQCYSPTTESDRLRAEVKKAPGANLDPTGSGPWLFIVFGTGTLGLYVRDGYTKDARRLPGDPTVGEGRPVYVDCYVNGWDSGQIATDPDPSMRSDRWYRVRYPDIPDVGSYWMSSGYLLPVGQNGNVPAC